MKTLNVIQVLEDSKYNSDTEIFEPVYVYKVIKVVNSLIPSITDTLTASLVEKYCDLKDWNVIIK